MKSKVIKSFYCLKIIEKTHPYNLLYYKKQNTPKPRLIFFFLEKRQRRHFNNNALGNLHNHEKKLHASHLKK
jgi:hypothetical protein